MPKFNLMNPLHIGFDAANRRVTLGQDDRRTHMHIIGASGSGKSKFLEWMLRGDLASGQGFALLDPHGTLYDAIISYAAHHVLDREIVMLNLSEPDNVIGFSPFRKATNGDISVQVEHRIAATFHAWNVANSDATPTLERTLRLIYTAMLENNLGLPQVAHLIDFNDHVIRQELIDHVQTPLIRKEWQELQSLKAREWRDEILSAKNRLFRFLTSTSLNRFLGLPHHSIDVFDVIEQGKVLIVNLAPSDHLSHENARVFGALLINEFFECARRRQKQEDGSDPAPYFLYMDEFADFIGLDIAAMLDQVRKFGLYLIMAHQRFGQIDENLLDAVLTNCGIKAVFGGLPVPSARRMAEELFIGELDPKKIKAAIYQTKFWPKYGRDKVYTQSHSYGTTHGSGTSEMSGTSTASASGESFTAADWFSMPTQIGMSTSNALTEMNVGGHSEMYAETESDSEGVADIPIFIPVPFQELSSVQYYPLDEQLTELTAALKNAYKRHCFIKIQERKTQPMLVPLVNDYYTSEENQRWYIDKQFAKQHALPVAQVDQLLKSQEKALMNTVAQSEVDPPKEPPSKKRSPKERKNIFESIDEDSIGRE